MLKVSVIIPIIRQEKAKRCIDALKEHAGIPEDEYEIIAEEDAERIGCPKMVKKLTDKSKAPLVCFIGDDTIPKKDFLKNALRAMTFNPDGWGMVSFNDNPNTALTAAHWLADKRLLPLLDGEFFHTGYSHCFCDSELMIRCQEMGKYIYAFDAYLEHDHPAVRGGSVNEDPDYKAVYAKERYEKDHMIFLERRATKWGKDRKEMDKTLTVMVGIPSGDMVHSAFTKSLINLMLYSYQNIPNFQMGITNPQFANLSYGRCEAVERAKRAKADKLLFLDSDMTFPADLLQKLLARDKKVICCDASTRKVPLRSVVVNRSGKPIDHTKENQQLIRLKRVTTAILLADMDVYKKIGMPYFEFNYDREKKQFTGEDYYFSDRARQEGFELWCDTELSKQIGHVGIYNFTLPKPGGNKPRVKIKMVDKDGKEIKNEGG